MVTDYTLRKRKRKPFCRPQFFFFYIIYLPNLNHPYINIYIYILKLSIHMDKKGCKPEFFYKK